MKKIFTKLLIIAIVSAILSMILCLFSISNNLMVPAEEMLGGIADVDSNSVTAGYEVIGRITGGGLAVFSVVALMVFILSGVFFIFLLIIIFQIVARLVQIGIEKKWKNTTSKVCAYISIALYIILCLMFLLTMLRGIFSYKILFAVIFNIYCVVIFIRTLSEKNILANITDNKIDEDNCLQ